MGFQELLKETENKILSKLEQKGYDIGISKDLQRTDEWFEQRRGKFTGSGIKKLMSTTRATSKMEWGRAEKTIDFNETAIKYIYEKAMERKRNKVIHLQTSAAMRYGTENEDIATQLFLNKNTHLEFTEAPFIEFIKGIAGASPDGSLIDTITGEVYGFENKCATSFDNVYSRMETAFDEKHQDFWQIQSELLALNVENLYYCVAEPSENIFEPNITDVQFKLVTASKSHQKSIIDRCNIGNIAIELFLNENISIHDAVNRAASNYKLKI